MSDHGHGHGSDASGSSDAVDYSKVIGVGVASLVIFAISRTMLAIFLIFSTFLGFR